MFNSYTKLQSNLYSLEFIEHFGEIRFILHKRLHQYRVLKCVVVFWTTW